jgi:hypothetical protein
MHTTYRALGAVILAGLLTSQGLLLAQPSGAEPEQAPAEFEFGPPLRHNILFSYQYQEKVEVKLNNSDGTLIDSSERTVTYYISERQKPAGVGGGALDIEANIDSMRLDYRGSGGDVRFNTQNQAHTDDLDIIRHPAVLVPSTLVNSVAHFTVSPYGSYVNMQSESFESIRKQGDEPTLDDFTQQRIAHMIDGRFLSTIFLPWKNVVPFGENVPYDRPRDRVAWLTMNRILFRDTVDVVLHHGTGDHSDGPVLEFQGDLHNPVSDWMTFDASVDPYLLSDAEGRTSGRFYLEKDGIVRSGFSTTNGTFSASFRGKKITGSINHQVFVELTNMTNFPVD